MKTLSRAALRNGTSFTLVGLMLAITISCTRAYKSPGIQNEPVKTVGDGNDEEVQSWLLANSGMAAFTVDPLKTYVYGLGSDQQVYRVKSDLYKEPAAWQLMHSAKFQQILAGSNYLYAVSTDYRIYRQPLSGLESGTGLQQVGSIPAKQIVSVGSTADSMLLVRSTDDQVYLQPATALAGQNSHTLFVPGKVKYLAANGASVVVVGLDDHLYRSTYTPGVPAQGWELVFSDVTAEQVQLRSENELFVLRNGEVSSYLNGNELELGLKARQILCLPGSCLFQSQSGEIRLIASFL